MQQSAMEAVHIFFILILIRDTEPQCTNVEPDGVCSQKAQDGECYFTPETGCKCTNHCQNINSCPKHPLLGDIDCYCRSPSLYSDCILNRAACAHTCDLRESVTCDPLLDVANAAPSNTNPRYLDIVTYDCLPGYVIVGGNSGKRICIDDGSWFPHSVNGTPPVCEAISCGSSPAVENATASQPDGVFGDVISFSCNDGFGQTGGEEGRMKCDETGSWSPVPGYGIPPECQEITSSTTVSREETPSSSISTSSSTIPAAVTTANGILGVEINQPSFNLDPSTTELQPISTNILFSSSAGNPALLNVQPLPTLSTVHTTFPGIPQATIPQVTIPQITIPQVTIQQVTIPQVSIPQVTIPQVTPSPIMVPEVSNPVNVASLPTVLSSKSLLPDVSNLTSKSKKLEVVDICNEVSAETCKMLLQSNLSALLADTDIMKMLLSPLNNSLAGSLVCFIINGTSAQDTYTKRIPVTRKFVPELKEAVYGQAFGAVAIIMFVITMSLVILVDLMNFNKHLAVFRKNTKGIMKKRRQNCVTDFELNSRTEEISETEISSMEATDLSEDSVMDTERKDEH